MARRIALAVVLVAGGCASSPTEAPRRRPPMPTVTPPVTPVTPPVTPAPPANATSVPPATTTTAPPPVEASSGRAAAAPPSLSQPGGAAATTWASWYARGRLTASGERFDPDGLTFAHRTMAFGALVRFCHAGACVVARCTDRGPAAWTGREFDLSRGAFAALAPLSVGVIALTWEAV